MNLKRIFRGPLFWILLITVTVLVVVEFAGSASGSRPYVTQPAAGSLRRCYLRRVKEVVQCSL